MAALVMQVNGFQFQDKVLPSSAPFFVQNKRKCLKTALEYQRVTEDGRVV